MKKEIPVLQDTDSEMASSQQGVISEGYKSHERKTRLAYIVIGVAVAITAFILIAI